MKVKRIAASRLSCILYTLRIHIVCEIYTLSCNKNYRHNQSAPTNILSHIKNVIKTNSFFYWYGDKFNVWVQWALNKTKIYDNYWCQVRWNQIHEWQRVSWVFSKVHKITSILKRIKSYTLLTALLIVISFLIFARQFLANAANLLCQNNVLTI